MRVCNPAGMNVERGPYSPHEFRVQLVQERGHEGFLLGCAETHPVKIRFSIWQLDL
jgi:hypothetical protein